MILKSFVRIDVVSVVEVCCSQLNSTYHLYADMILRFDVEMLVYELKTSNTRFLLLLLFCTPSDVGKRFLDQVS